MLIYLLKGIMCYSFFFDRAYIHTWRHVEKHCIFSQYGKSLYPLSYSFCVNKKSIIKYLFLSLTCFTLIYAWCSTQFKFFQFYLLFWVMFLIVFDSLKEQGENKTLYIHHSNFTLRSLWSGNVQNFNFL